MNKKMGTWAFIIGIILALIAGIIPAWQTPTVMWILVVLGIIVGLLNVTSKETTEFLVATIALMIVGSAGLGALPALGTTVAAILKNIVAFVAPAALVVAIKAVFDLAGKR